MIDEKKIKSAVDSLKKNGFKYGDVEALIDLAEQVLSVKMPKKEKLDNGKYGICGEYICDAYEHGFNWAIDLCTLAIAKEYTHNETVKLLEEKIEILEEEREKWWSKAEKPDDIYLTPDILDDYVKREDVVNELDKIANEINMEIASRPQYPNLGKKGCLRRIESALNKFKGGNK